MQRPIANNVDGIEHRQTKPYTPKTNGMVERANGLIKQGTTKIHTYQNAKQMKNDLDQWFVYYNFYRKHRSIGKITHYQAVCQWHHTNNGIIRTLNSSESCLTNYSNTVHNLMRLDT